MRVQVERATVKFEAGDEAGAVELQSVTPRSDSGPVANGKGESDFSRKNYGDLEREGEEYRRKLVPEPGMAKSFDILMSFLRLREDGTLDCSRMLCFECFDLWLKTRKGSPKDPPRAFKDAIKSIVMATSRSRPFNREVEAALLIELRKKQIWDCFKGMEGVNIGQRGWKIKGYHESKREKEAAERCANPASDTTPIGSPEPDSATPMSVPISPNVRSTTSNQAPPATLEQNLDFFGEGGENDENGESGEGDEGGESGESGESGFTSSPDLISLLHTSLDTDDLLSGFPIVDKASSLYSRTQDFLETPLSGLAQDEITSLPPMAEGSRKRRDRGLEEYSQNVLNQKSPQQSHDLVPAYDVFEALCSYPTAGYEYHYPTLQVLLEPAVAKRFHALRMMEDPRLDINFICPKECSFVEGRHIYEMVCVYKGDGTPYRVVERPLESIDLFGSDILGKDLPCAPCVMYDAWIVFAFESSGSEAKLFKGEQVWNHSIIARADGSQRVMRSTIQCCGLHEDGGYKMLFRSQDVSDVLEYILRLPKMF